MEKKLWKLTIEMWNDQVVKADESGKMTNISKKGKVDKSGIGSHE